MKVVKAEGGRAVAVRLDAASRARLNYLEAYYHKLGVQASHSALVRRALAVLTEEVSKLVLRARSNGPKDGRVMLATKLIAWDAQNNAAPCPWRDGLPALGDAEQYPSFPTWKELQAPSKATPTPILLQPFANDDE